MNAPDSNEQVSAFVDGELRGPARDRVVDALYGSPELRRAWARFHLIGDALRKIGPVPGAGSIAGNVSVVLSADPVVPFKPPPRRLRLVPFPALAVAAAIAAVAVIAIRGLDDGGTPPPAVAGASRHQVAMEGSPPAAPDPAASRTASAGSETARRRWSDAAPDAETRLNVYLVNHNEYAGNGVGGVLPYVRIVGYQSTAGDHR